MVASVVALSATPSLAKKPKREPVPVVEAKAAPTPGTVAAIAADEPGFAALIERIEPEARARILAMPSDAFDAAFSTPEHQRTFEQEEVVRLVGEVETLGDAARHMPELAQVLELMDGDLRARATAMPMGVVGKYAETRRAEVPEAEREILDAIDAAFAMRFDRSLAYRTGTIDLSEAGARLVLGDAYRFLGPDETERVLTEAWGNPPSTDAALGMIVPVGASVASPGTFGIIVHYVADGHVDDDDAEDIDYAELLTEMKTATREGNAARRAAGAPDLELVGWAEPPHYDGDNHRLYWARELSATGEPMHTLNYDVRILGRKGVLGLNAVGSMDQLDAIGPAMESLLGAVEFETGHRYQDFDPDLDEVAAYGIGGLIAGKVAMKVGFFAVILKALIAAKKLVIVGAIAVGALVTGWLRRKRGGGES